MDNSKRLIFTVTSGRSGTLYLTRLLSGLPNVAADHEPWPYFHDVLPEARHRPEIATQFLKDVKLPFIDSLRCKTYFEASHYVCKGFLDPLLQLGIVPDLILLRREPRKVACSWFLISSSLEFPKNGKRYKHMLGAHEPSFLPAQGFEHWNDYQRCYWYALENHFRVGHYAKVVAERGGRLFETFLEPLATAEGYESLLRWVGMPENIIKARVGDTGFWQAKINEKLETKQRHGHQHVLPTLDLDALEAAVRRDCGLTEKQVDDLMKKRFVPAAPRKKPAPARKPAKRPRIFVNIASYRDPEISPTLHDLFAKAAYPERISAGVCLQVDPKEDKHCLVETGRKGQVRVHQVDYRDSKGANWARAEAFKQWDGEEYVLHIDSHMRFELGWDEVLIDALNACPSPKPVISSYVPNYEPPDNRDANRHRLLRIRLREFGRNENDPQLLHLTGTPMPLNDPERGGLYRSPFCICNFIFARTHMFQDIPFDPHIPFWGDEITFSARLWTHGYDIFQLDRIVLFHYWLRKDTMYLQNYRRTDTAASRHAVSRVKHLLGFETAGDKEALVDLDRYALGKERGLAGLWAFAGIDWERRTALPDSFEGRWHGTQESRDRLAAKPALAALPKKSPDGSLPKIFVNIASYRDPECQWTVKDLFEKAAHPDRINVGICWQFDPQEDKHCFEIGTRPEQVRIYPVDWREAHGVCWARHQTQQLWDGEEYNLMIDSHMRFVPGWDELMIAELAACDSAKPVLSCSPPRYEPPDTLSPNVNPSIRRVKPFMPDGNIRCQGEMLNRVPEKPLNGAFIVANFVFSRSEIIQEVPYDPYLYFDQEEITYAARLYTHGWDVFSPRRQFLYHYYNDRKQLVQQRPLHWNDLRKENEARIQFLSGRGLERFNHMTGYSVSDLPEVISRLDIYGFGRVRTLAQFEEYSGIDFKRKFASEKALRALFIKDLHKYRDAPVYVPELDDKNAPKEAVMHNTMDAPVKVTPKMQADPVLEPGDFVPFFQAPDSDGKTFMIETHGGKHCVLLFLPTSNPDYLSRFFRTFYKSLAQERLDAWYIFILDGTIEQLAAFKSQINLQHALVADPERKIALAFGLCKTGEPLPPAGFVLNRNLQVVKRHLNLEAKQFAEAMQNDCRHAIEEDRRLNAHPQVFSRMPPMLVVPNVFTAAFRARCLDAFRSGHTFEGTVGGSVKSSYRPTAKVRTDHIVTPPLLQEIDEKLSRSLFPEIKKVFGFEVTHREIYKIGLYTGEKGGFFKPHRDNFDLPLSYRRIAMTLHLNDDYEGGGLRFPEYGDDIFRPHAGDAVAFSCGTMHEARPVTSGERFIVVGFFHGDEEEAFRRKMLADKGAPLNIEAYEPALRQYHDLKQSRHFYDDWRKRNVRYDGRGATEKPPVFSIHTLNGNRPKKVFESKQAIIFDDFLPEDTYRKIRDHALKADYEYINTQPPIKRAWHVHDGFPLRSTLNPFYFAQGVPRPQADYVYPTRTEIDLFIDNIRAVQPHVQDIVGREGMDWKRFSVTEWLYPAGTALSMHDDGAGVYSGAYVFFLNELWKPHWGGLLILMDEEANKAGHDHGLDAHEFYRRQWQHANVLDETLMEHGLAKCIFPKKNRIVFIANDAYHMVTRVNETAGDNLRTSIAGFFHRKEK